MRLGQGVGQQFFRETDEYHVSKFKMQIARSESHHTDAQVMHKVYFE